MVPVEAEFGACQVAIDQAGVGIVGDEAGLGGGPHREIQERFGHGGPGGAGIRVGGVVAVAGAVRYPAHTTAVGHGDGHGIAAGRDQMAERRARGDARDGFDQRGGLGSGEAAQ